MPTITNIFGQCVSFSDGSALHVPYTLTPRKGDNGITLMLDATRRVMAWPLDVQKQTFVNGVNILLLQIWIAGGRDPNDKPNMVQPTPARV